TEQTRLEQQQTILQNLEAVAGAQAQVEQLTQAVAAGQMTTDQMQEVLAENGIESPEILTAQQTQLEQAQRLADFASLITTISADRSTALGQVLFADDAFTLSPEVKNSVVESVTSAAIPGVNVDFPAELTQTVEGLLGIGEVLGVFFAVVVLVVLLRTFVA